jgi:hypothetical protein
MHTSKRMRHDSSQHLADNTGCGVSGVVILLDLWQGKEALGLQQGLGKHLQAEACQQDLGLQNPKRSGEVLHWLSPALRW